MKEIAVFIIVVASGEYGLFPIYNDLCVNSSVKKSLLH